MSEILKLVGSRIRDVRKSRGLSQEALAEKAGFNSSYIGFIERAERNISLVNLEKIAKALNVGVYQLFSYVREYEDLTENETRIKEILSVLKNRDQRDLDMVRNVLIEIFERYDNKSNK
ncbi:transcriptional regulator [Paenibacillus elgii]|uniref:Transcriptional regulator n=1 Tax=Paenibacillus elgii TaxID=189691 RepID=A0A2T6GA59_9BACL|nr:helix-turn-helix transcriptional regulator [Paenibacillus elgii]PUA41048.1 transcriptional regulator [Paenibacillus elgii]